MSSPTIIKKYSNRRLYDTGESRYITLNELGDKIRQGTDVRVVDAKSGDELTQATLTQILLEEHQAASMIPAPVLTQLIRMDHKALAEFFEHYMSFALATYLESHPGSDAMAFYNWFSTNPLASKALTRRWMTAPFGSSRVAQKYPEHGAASPAGAEEPSPRSLHHLAGEVDELRREIDEIKQLLLGSDEPHKRAKRRRTTKDPG